MYSFTVLGVGRAMLFLKALGKNPSCLFFSFWCIPVTLGILCLIDALTSIFASVFFLYIFTFLSVSSAFKSLLPFSYNTKLVDVGPTVIWCDLISAWLYLQRSNFQITSCSQVPRVRTLEGTQFNPLLSVFGILYKNYIHFCFSDSPVYTDLLKPIKIYFLHRPINHCFLISAFKI